MGFWSWGIPFAGRGRHLQELPALEKLIICFLTTF
jgi:hypothetical protein